jgi:methylenetetrahydrofolate reductase (NADPH)
VHRLDAAGVRDVFVVGGDGEPAGAFADAGELLAAFAELGHGFAEIGIAGYPEGHPSIREPELLAAMQTKARSATYVVSQVCFEPHAVAAWVERLRRAGIALPVYVGVPGAVSTARLLRLSLRIGVGESVRFLRRGGGWLGRILLGGTFDPGRLLDGLAPLFADPAAGARGLHLYTFNEVARTETWRRGKLASLRRAA